MITRQEMFDRAVRGLAAQGFQKCMDVDNQCVYAQRSTSMRCAWGHVDKTLTHRHGGTVMSLHTEKIGIAAELNKEDLTFAYGLQLCHDTAMAPSDMRNQLTIFCEKHHLAWPKEIPRYG